MTIDLHGNWSFSINDSVIFSNPDFDDTAWQQMRIPQNWFLAGLDHHGVVWFRREFIYDPSSEHPCQTLHFDGVDYFSDIYLNGMFLGHHTGYFDPFSYDISQILIHGKNLLAARVDSPYETPGLDGWHLRKRLIKGVLNHHDCRPGGGWDLDGQSYNTGGIWNRIYIEEHDLVTVTDFLLRADLNTQPPILHAEILLFNRAEKQHSRLEVRCVPGNFKGKEFSTEIDLDIPAGQSHSHVQLSVPGVELWQPWDRGHPNLYKVTLTLEEENYASLFGFRTVRVDDGFHWHINDQPYFLRGSNYLPTQWLSEALFPEVAYSKTHPFGRSSDFLSLNNDDCFSRDVALARQANLNLLRVHAHILPSEFHAACDRAGMLVWQDFPLQWGYTDDPSFHNEAERQIRAMVKMLYNHPSIVAWCCHNESPCDAPWMAGEVGGLYDPTHNRDLDILLEKTVKETDPTRYVHRNSGIGDGHTYPGWYFGHWHDYKDLPAAPFCTEYGAQGLPVKESLLRTFTEFGSDAGHAEMVCFKSWLETQSNYRIFAWFKNNTGRWLGRMESVRALQPLLHWLMKFGMEHKGFPYSKIPKLEATPPELHPARKIWEIWRFHNFQPQETFDNGISLGTSLDEFIANSQAYQRQLIQYATETYRRNKGCKVTGIIQFDFTDPWPAITWSVLDYWRTPKPAFDALRCSMQPVLPSFQLPERIKANKVFNTSLCVINDFLEAFPGAKCSWNLKIGTEEVNNGEWSLDIPANEVSAATTVSFPALSAGAYQLTVVVTSANRKILAENEYLLKVNSKVLD